MIEMGGPTIGLREKIAVLRQLNTGQLAQGRQVRRFEKLFSNWVGVENAVALNSGTSALHLGLLALGIGPGDEVIVPSFSFAATANAVALTGAKPVFCDVEEDYYTMDAHHARSMINSQTKAILPVHLYGQLADMSAIWALAKEKNLLVVEDSAQAHGASLRGVPSGGWGDLAAFSFYPSKNMTTGEGGMITTMSDSVARMARLLRNQGMEAKYQNEVIGFNNRMTEIAAVIGIEQLSQIEKFNRKRRRNAAHLIQRLGDDERIVLPKTRPDSFHVYHQFTIRVRHDRDRVLAKMADLGVRAAVYYPAPINELPAYGQHDIDLPVTKKLCGEVLSLPINPSLSRKAIDLVATTLQQALRQS